MLFDIGYPFWSFSVLLCVFDSSGSNDIRTFVNASYLSSSFVPIPLNYSADDSLNRCSFYICIPHLLCSLLSNTSVAVFHTYYHHSFRSSLCIAFTVELPG